MLSKMFNGNRKTQKANWEFTENKSRTRETDYSKKKDNGTSQVIFFFFVGILLLVESCALT